MQIYEILNEALSPEIAMVNIETAARSLTNLINQILKKRNADPDKNETWMLSSTLGRWTSSNFLSSNTRSLSGYNIESAVSLLSKYPKYRFIKSQLDGVHLSLDKELNDSSEILTHKIGNMLVGILNAKTSNNEDARQLSHALTNLSKKGEVTKSTTRVPDKRPVDKTATQTLNPQIETLINQVLSDLPKDVSHRIRQKLSKSDDKLGTLKREMALL